MLRRQAPPAFGGRSDRDNLCLNIIAQRTSEPHPTGMHQQQLHSYDLLLTLMMSPFLQTSVRRVIEARNAGLTGREGSG